MTMFPLFSFLIRVPLLVSLEAAVSPPGRLNPEEIISRLPGRVERAEDLPGKPVIAVDLSGNSKTGFRASDEDLALLPAFGELCRLNLARAKLTAQGLAHLKRLKKLRELNLDGAELSGDALNALLALESLETLSLGCSTVTGACTETLKGMKGLRRLNLVLLPISDRDAKALGDLTELRELNLSGVNHLTDKGFAELKRLGNLESLNVAATHITDAGLKAIADLPNLKILDISYNNQLVIEKPSLLQWLGFNVHGITNQGLKHLATAKRLETINIEGTDISKEGILRYLRGLPSLREVYLDDLFITARGLRELQKVMPKVRFTQKHRARV